MKKYLLILGLSLTSGCYEPSDLVPVPGLLVVETPVSGEISGELAGCWVSDTSGNDYLRFDKISDQNYTQAAVIYRMQQGDAINLIKEGNKLNFQGKLNDQRILVLTADKLTTTNFSPNTGLNAKYTRTDASNCKV